MAENNFVDTDSSEVIIAKAKDLWARYSKALTIASLVVILVGGGYYAYSNFVVKPKEAKASEVMFKAEEYYRMDSVSKALNGDGLYWGFLKVIDKYGGTKTGNMANYYAGSCYIKLNDNEKALKYLKAFSTDSKALKSRAYKLMADAYADLNRGKEALEYYQKAGRAFKDDENFSAECLFMGAYLAQKSLNDTKTATDLYKEIKEKYPRTQQGYDADNYLAQMGVYKSDN
jgi:tetratricopeptide (TPR) repeat protein